MGFPVFNNPLKNPESFFQKGVLPVFLR